MGIEHIEAVNHWRGQCLDNFARAEKAIIGAYLEPVLAQSAKPPRLHETATQRTRNLAGALRANWPKDREAQRLSLALDHWSLREKERNRLVHGTFKVSGEKGLHWSFVNESLEIKKGVISETCTLHSQMQAEAFLESVRAERKRLESALKSIALFKP